MDDDWEDPYNYSCHDVGINGGCGIDCPVLQRGDCEITDVIVDTCLEAGMKEELIVAGLINYLRSSSSQKESRSDVGAPVKTRNLLCKSGYNPFASL